MRPRLGRQLEEDARAAEQQHGGGRGSDGHATGSGAGGGVSTRRKRPGVSLTMVIGISVVASSPSLVLFALFMSYALSGYVMWAMGHRVRPVLPEE